MNSKLVLARVAAAITASAFFVSPSVRGQDGEAPASAVQAPATTAGSTPVRRTRPWDPELVRIASTIPVQEDGRVKPLSTFAAFKLLQLNGARTLSLKLDPQGDVVADPEERTDLTEVKLTPTEWLLDCLFFPDQASRYPCFQLQTWEVADAIHVTRSTKSKRDRYSYDELAVGREELTNLADKLINDPEKREAKNRTATEEQIVQLYEKLPQFEYLTHFLDFARHRYPVPADGSVATLFGGAKEVRFTAILEKAPLLIETARSLKDAVPTQGDTKSTPELDALRDFVSLASDMSRYGVGLWLFPPDGTTKAEPKWLSIASLFELRFFTHDPTDRLMPALAALEQSFDARADFAAMKAPLTRFHDEVVKLASERGEYRKIESEDAFYRADLFAYAQWLYVLAFIAVAVGWMLAPSHWLQRWLPLAVAVPWSLHVAGIVWRCYLRARPPVSTLYETILFISGVAVLASTLTELINRRRIAIALAAAIGAGGLFLAGMYEAKEAYDSGGDTMPQLQAVLDTNFWLSTHVTSVTIGYSAGLLAGFLAHVFILGRFFGLKKDNADFYRAVARMTYGALCFGLLFSVVGTILGGVWANDSWGRFWGWDPKENGALMICLWELSILHARMGGYVRDLGICTAAVFGNVVVAFSWWGVNLLSVGLHTYGFTHGLLGKLYVFYGIEALVILAGLCLWLGERQRRKLKPPLPTAPHDALKAGT